MSVLNPRVDFAFKKLFGSEENEELKIEPAIEKAFLSLNTLSLGKEEREIYEARLKWLRDEDATLQKAHEKGIEQITINMLKDNEPLDKISRFTGLSQADIIKLKNKL